MKTQRRPLMTALALPLCAWLVPFTVHADEPQCFYESRSGVNVECGIYHSEISNTEAFLNTQQRRGKWSKQRPVMLDVRSIPEYKAGHPARSYNVPYPFIYQECDAQGRYPDGACIRGGARIAQVNEDFVSYVERIVPNKTTPIYTLCRTGVRSVGAANRLTEAGYTNVRNMWEGFVGIYLKAPQIVGYESDGVTPIIADDFVDLNHDGLLTDQDKNGWLYHQGLPWETRLTKVHIYQPYEDYYRYDD